MTKKKLDERAENVLQYMRAVVQMKKQMANKPSSFKFLGVDDFVIKKGYLFTVMGTVPPYFRERTMRECFKNATLLATSHPDLTYVEGYAYNVALAVNHAWCIDKQGRVIDPTWVGGGGYIGVPFKTDFVLELVTETGYYGLLDAWYAGWPVLTKFDQKKMIHPIRASKTVLRANTL